MANVIIIDGFFINKLNRIVIKYLDFSDEFLTATNDFQFSVNNDV